MSEQIRIRVPDGAKERLKKAAKEAGYPTLSDYLRSWIGAPHSRKTDPLVVPVAGSKRRVETRLGESEKASFLAICQEENISVAQALRRQVRIAITNGPDFCGHEILAMRECNRQLMAIGRNLNQVVKKMHQDDKSVPWSLIENLLKEVNEMREAFTAVSDRSAQRSRQ